ncbi:MAG: hypothetical protein C0501_25220 [Isosphaera sp.]|nr:hypothetical protein [Isosphaera sp.]
MKRPVRPGTLPVLTEAVDEGVPGRDEALVPQRAEVAVEDVLQTAVPTGLAHPVGGIGPPGVVHPDPVHELGP